MPSNLENLQSAKASAIAKLAEIIANQKPSYQIDGQAVSWTDYYRMLTDQIEAINKLLIQEDPYFLLSQAM